jgi:hypothetical protein
LNPKFASNIPISSTPFGECVRNLPSKYSELKKKSKKKEQPKIDR